MRPLIRGYFPIGNLFKEVQTMYKINSAFCKSLIGIICLLVCYLPAFSQSSGAIVGVDYGPVEEIKGAPGQIITLRVYGVGRDVTQTVRANTTPLPTVLANISLTLHPDQVSLPILAISPVLRGLMLITVQIPFDISFVPEVTRNRSIVVSENGVAGENIRFRTAANSVHILRNCDTHLVRSDTLLCGISVVAHADGSLVTQTNPARPGEEVTIQAVGLGVTEPRQRAGETTQNFVPLARPLLADFDFTPNAPPKDVRGLSLDNALPTTAAGLAPGTIGIYQVKVRIPAVMPRPTVPCSDHVKSNLTISIGVPPTTFPTLLDIGSYDGAGVCVETQAGMLRGNNRRLIGNQ
jgi:uncharacterized protein (TIGR03437 family)